MGLRKLINPYNKEVKDLTRSQVIRLPCRGPISKPVFGFRDHVVVTVTRERKLYK